MTRRACACRCRYGYGYGGHLTTPWTDQIRKRLAGPSWSLTSASARHGRMRLASA
ncbi:hypothetical protein [Streptomyces sp. NPDC059378]|uniref:hypothetical protein n=1 Tax=Streptomyces sp. NPDC059378 TaxID=3346815 RepID=UPI0036A7F721